MRVLREIFVSVAPMDRSPRWHKPAGRLDQPARPRRVLAVIRVLVLLAAPPPPPPRPPPAGAGAEVGGSLSPRFPPAGRPAVTRARIAPPMVARQVSRVSRAWSGLVDFLVAWFGGVGQPWAAQGALGGGRHGCMQPTCSAARNGASVASRIRCRRLRAAIGAQRKAQRAAHTERIGKRCNAAL